MSNTVTYEEVLVLPEKPHVFFVDVREADEIQSTGLIPGSKHIPLGDVISTMTTTSEEDFRKKFDCEKPTMDSSIVITCRSGRRALVAVNELAKLGYVNCKYYPGSWLEWEKNGKE